ncbi:MAG TPA: hypothetical protein VHX37_01675 [Acidobacteriaceae bacterium]|jgi:hypothetical protein|nr:hypothetical protein [Acidobacteriaceae bacterium]
MGLGNAQIAWISTDLKFIGDAPNRSRERRGNGAAHAIPGGRTFPDLTGRDFSHPGKRLLIELQVVSAADGPSLTLDENWQMAMKQ